MTYMRTISVSDARAVLPTLLDEVADGHEVTITRHGAAVAVLVHPDAVRSRRIDDAAARAQQVVERVTAAAQRNQPAASITAARADELVAEVAAGRRR